jgi:hypothetical protein
MGKNNGLQEFVHHMVGTHLMIKVLFCALVLMSASCSNSSDAKSGGLSTKAQNTITLLQENHTNGIISDSQFSEAKENVMSYDSRGFFGKYWFGAVFLLYLVGTMLFARAAAPLDRVKPMRASRPYGFWLLGGFWGCHHTYLWSWVPKFDNEENYGRYFLIWTWISWISMIFVLLLNYTALMYFYDMPQLLLINSDTWSWNTPNSNILWISIYIFCIISIVNVVSGLLAIPYWTYMFNAKYFRRNPENDAILSNQRLSVDNSLADGQETISHITQDLETITERVEGDYIIEDSNRDDSFWGGTKRFFKNVATLGNSAKLEEEMDRLRLLSACCKNLQRDINKADCLNSDLYDALEEYRAAAYRNLYLAKELIGLVKSKVSSKAQKRIVDTFLEVYKPEGMTGGNVRLDDAALSFNTDLFMQRFGSDMSETLTCLNDKIEKGGTVNKDDFIVAGIELAFSSALNGLENIIDLYSSTKQARAEVQDDIASALKYIKKAIPSIQNYLAALLRQAELLTSLSNANKAFIKAYEPLREEVFGDPSFSQYIFGLKDHKELFASDKFREDLQYLIRVCSEYNKINQAKL